MKKTVFFTALNLWVSLIFAQYSGGLGTKVNPYQIANLTDLGNLSSTSLDWNKHFILKTISKQEKITLDRMVKDYQIRLRETKTLLCRIYGLYKKKVP